MKRKSNKNRTTIFWLRARYKLLYCMRRANKVLRILLSLRLLERNIRIFGKTLSTVSLSLNTDPFSSAPPFYKQAGTSSTPLCESILTPHCQQEPIYIPPPSNSLFCSPLPSLALPFSAKSQIGGWGVFCGPNKRAKVVRTPLYESVGGEHWPKQLVFQAWAYTDQQAWAVAWQQ